MKRFILFLLFLSLPLAFSSCKEETTPTKEEVILESIACLDKDFNEIDKITYSIYQTEYIYQNVYIYAYYSDGTSGDVTAFADFSSIDLETVGEKEVIVSYKGLSDKFIVEVKNTPLSRIEINSNDCKKVYSINEKLDLSNLLVYAFYETGKKEEVRDYECTVYDESGFEYTKDSFIKTGTYKILIKYENKYDEFYIYVYPEYEIPLNIDYADLPLDINGVYSYKANELIFEDALYSFVASGNPIMSTKNVSNNFFENEFNYTFDIDSENGLIFNVSTSFEMLIIIEGNYNNPLYIRDLNDNNINYYMESSGENTLIFVQGINSVYDIIGISKAKILGIFLNIIEEKNVLELILDTNNVKINFKDNEHFNYEGLIVKGRIAYDEYIEISPEEYEVTLYKNNKIVNDFTETGFYVVEVYYRYKTTEFTQKYDIYVEKAPTEYSYLELNLNNVKTEFGTNEKFNYDYLAVYGYVTPDEMVVLNPNEYQVALFFTDGYNSVEVDSFAQIPGQYYVIVSYKNENSILTERYDITYDLGIVEYKVNPEIIIEINDKNEVVISVENVLSVLKSIKFKIYDEDNNIQFTYSSMSSTISNLDPKENYTLRGYYIGKLNNQEYIVYLEDTEINFN